MCSEDIKMELFCVGFSILYLYGYYEIYKWVYG